MSIRIKKTYFSLVLLALIMLSPTITQGGSTAQSKFCVLPLCQQGTNQLTIPANCGVPCLASATINFPIAFSKPPTVGVLNVSNVITAIESSYTILAPGTAASWTAMPLAQTELFGASRNEIVAELSTEGTPNCGLFVNVVTPGTAAAILRVQWSADLVTWTNWLPTPGGDVSIAASGFTASTDGFDPLVAPLSVPFLRIVGLGGNGVVSPSFGNIQIDCFFQTTFSSVFVNTGVGAITATHFSVSLSTIFEPDNGRTVSFTWIAYL